MSTPSHPNYQIIILSDNYFLWLGLKTAIDTMMTPRPDVFWINEVSPESIFRMREQVMMSHPDCHWLVFTDASRISDIQIYLPADRVKVMADDLSVSRLMLSLRSGDFTSASVPDATLTRSELRVCTLISKGISLVRIAQLLNKSPKTIYTHKRNAMSKFHCHNLAEFHRKICLLEQKSLYL